MTDKNHPSHDRAPPSAQSEGPHVQGERPPDQGVPGNGGLPQGVPGAGFAQPILLTIRRHSLGRAGLETILARASANVASKERRAD